jgi:hypothetical protein
VQRRQQKLAYEPRSETCGTDAHQSKHAIAGMGTPHASQLLPAGAYDVDSVSPTNPGPPGGLSYYARSLHRWWRRGYAASPSPLASSGTRSLAHVGLGAKRDPSATQQGRSTIWAFDTHPSATSRSD